MDSRSNIFTAHLGRDAWGNRLFVEVEVTIRSHAGVTINHEPVDGGYRSLSFTGWTIRKHTQNTWDSAGQVLGLLKGMTEIAKGWTQDDVTSLRKLAKEWHLNDMQAGCAHMDLTGVPADYNSRRHITCPETGYKYGSAWLVKPIPGEVWEEIHRLACLPTGTIVK